jgi:mannose-6-phosphate isomerase-like protein (cupin superfamily)
MIKITKKPWGEEHLFAHGARYAGKILVVRKGHRMSMQYHVKKEETMYLVAGRLKLTIGKNKNRLSQKIVDAGHVIHLPPKTIHRMEALKHCRLIEVSTPELDDIVRIADDYNRCAEKPIIDKR